MNAVLDSDLDVYEKGRVRLPSDKNVGGPCIDEKRNVLGRFYLASDGAFVFSFNDNKRIWAVTLHDVLSAVMAADELYVAQRGPTQPKENKLSKRARKAAARQAVKSGKLAGRITKAKAKLKAKRR